MKAKLARAEEHSFVRAKHACFRFRLLPNETANTWPRSAASNNTTPKMSLTSTVFLLLTVSSAFATTFYVASPPVGSDANSGASGAPFATISHVRNHLLNHHVNFLLDSLTAQGAVKQGADEVIILAGVFTIATTEVLNFADLSFGTPRPLHIHGETTNSLTIIKASPSTQLIQVLNSGANVVRISDLTLLVDNASGIYGAGSSLQLADLIVSRALTAGRGPSFTATNLVTLSVSNCFFDGGAPIRITKISGTGTFTNTIFQNSINTASSLPGTLPGGALYIINSGSVTFNGCTWRDSHSDFAGCLYAETSTLVFNDCTWERCSGNNTSGFHGGAMKFWGVQATLNRATIRDNTAYSGSGMTLSGASKVTIEGSIIEGNTQSEFSCVQLQTKATLFVSNTLFRNNAGTNFASAYGGAISASASVVDIGNCTFINNTAAQGGSVFMVVGAIGNPRLTITDSHFEGNAAFLGGAIAYGSATDEPTLVTITIARSTFKSNVADNAKAIIPWIPATGGALYIQIYNENVKIEGCNFIDNVVRDSGILIPANTAMAAAGGGAVFVHASKSNWTEEYTNSIRIYDSSFLRNYAYTSNPIRATSGALLSFTEHLFEVRNCSFVENSAESLTGYSIGGAAYFGAATTFRIDGFGGARLNMTDTLFESNVAQVGGGVIFFPSIAKIRNSKFVRNNATFFAGAIYVAGTADVRASTYVDIAHCEFDGNVAGENYTNNGDGWPVLVAAIDTTLVLGPNTYKNSATDYSKLFSYEIRIFQASVQLVPDDGALDGAVVMHPSILLESNGTLDTTKVELHIERFLVSSLLAMGNYDISVSRELVLAGRVNATGVGKLRSFESLLLYTEETISLNNAHVSNEGRGLLYPRTSLRFVGSVFENVGSLVSTDFAPQPSIVLDSQSSFINKGYLELCTINFGTDGSFVQESSGELRFRMSNFFQPSSLDLPVAEINGKLTMDSEYFKHASQPTPAQSFVLYNASLTTIDAFQTVSHLGGYEFTFQTTTENSRIIKRATVTKFFPIAAKLSESGTSIRVTFPRPTNSPTGPCSSLLPTALLAKFSADVVCAWEASDTLAIRASTLVVVNTSISFLEGAIKDSESDALVVSSHSISLAGPLVPPLLSSVLVGPTTISPCSDLVLDASASTGGGAYPRAYVWTLVSTTSLESTAALSSYLASLPSSASVASIDASLFPPTAGVTFTFQVSISTELHPIGSLANLTVTRVDDGTLELFIEGPSTRYHFTNRPLQLTARLLVPGCFNVAQHTVSYLWKHVGGPSFTTSPAKLDQLTLTIPAFAMAPGAVYNLQLETTITAKPSGASRILATAPVEITGIGSHLSLFNVGSSGLTGTASQLLLGVQLVDPSNSNSDINFEWSVIECPLRGQRNTKADSGLDDETGYLLQQVSTNKLAEEILTGKPIPGKNVNGTQREDGLLCQSQSGVPVALSFNNSATQTLPGGLLAPGAYAILVEVVKDLRYTSTVIFIQIVEQSVAPFTSVAIAPQLFAPKLLPQQKLVLRGLINGVAAIPANAQVKWSCMEPDIAAKLASSPERYMLSPSNSLNWSLAPETLPSGRYYRFKMEISSSSGVLGRNVVGVVVNPAPFGGSIALQPDSTSFIQGDLVDISSPGWEDDDVPLTYIFSAVVDGQEIILSDASTMPRFVTRLPFAGNETNGYAVRLLVRVFDSAGSMSINSRDISVTPNATFVLAAQQLLNTSEFLRDFRSAGEAIIVLATDANRRKDASIVLRERMSRMMLDFVTTHTLDTSGVNYALRLVTLITRLSSGISSATQSNVMSILEQVVESAYVAATQGNSIGSTKVFSSADSFSLQATSSVISTIESLLPTLSLQTKKRLTLAIEPARIVALISKIGRINSAIAELNESPTAMTGDYMQIIAAKVAGFVSLSTPSGTSIEFEAPSPVNITVIDWSTSFPLGSVSSHVVTIEIGQGAIFDVTFSYDGADPNLQCGMFNETTNSWGSGCQLTRLLSNRISCKCDATGATGGAPVHIGLLFGSDALPINGSAPDSSNLGSNIGAIAASVVVVVVVVAAIGAGGFGYWLIRKKKREAEARMTEALHRSLPDNEKTRATPTPALDGARGSEGWKKGDRSTAITVNSV